MNRSLLILRLANITIHYTNAQEYNLYVLLFLKMCAYNMFL